jgi:hypothetical protein
MQSQHKTQQHRSTTTIDDLPDVVLELIFNRTSFEDQLVCGCVCKHWLEVTSQNFTFMRKVQFNIIWWGEETEFELVRMYKIIKIIGEDIAWADQKFCVYLAKCEKFELNRCQFESIGHLAHIISNCKSLKILYLNVCHVKDSGFQGLQAVKSCANINAIDLTLETKASNWKILQLFKIIKLDISELHIVYDGFASNSQIADFMEYVHQNHRLAFRTLALSLFDGPYSSSISALPVLIFTQIKQLRRLSIPIDGGQMLDLIGKNLTELQYLKLNIYGPTNFNNLNTLSKLQHLKIEMYSPTPLSLNLYINKLHQLKFLEVTNYSYTSGTFTLNFSDLTPQHQLRSMQKLIVYGLIITRNMLQLIFETMQNLESLRIVNGRPSKPLSRNNNAIGQLKSLQQLVIDDFWVDENFLRNMKLPQLQHLTLFYAVSLSDFSNVGLLHLAKHCPKLLEIKTGFSHNPIVIASRKTAGCIFNAKICEMNNLSDVFFGR